MGGMEKSMKEIIKQAEQNKAEVQKGIYREAFHLMPPVGWLNDPNGLCFFKGYYHVFFQYAPQDAEGGLKCWGHYRSKDLLEWEYLGVPIIPDSKADKDGAYSGCAFVEDGMLELFYTGNVKKEGDYDYIYEGREANVLYTCSKDGIHFSKKEVLLKSSDYPKGYTCHIRDPKVWKEGHDYYMVLGGRKAGENGQTDCGAVLVYRSKDKKHWQFLTEFLKKEAFGYMWECPDYFTLQSSTVLAFCPQGLLAEKLRFQNQYQAGYIFCKPETVLQRKDGEKTVLSDWEASVFLEWDRGFDFYAPQTFLDEGGRRLLIGWAGMFDADYTNQALMKEGWQHCLSLPRKLELADKKTENGDDKKIILQNPAEEIDRLRGKELFSFLIQEESASKEMVIPLAFDTGILDIWIVFGSSFEKKGICLEKDLCIVQKNGMIELVFQNESGEGRRKRSAPCDSLENIRVLKDRSVLEIFINNGELVFTTHYFPKSGQKCLIELFGRIKEVKVWEMKGFYE